MTDDDRLDLRAVAADDAAVERLRGGDPGDDTALGLLHDLLRDVETDLPPDKPVGRGSTVLLLAGDDAPERRLARGGVVVAVLAAGLVSLGGVAAASTLLPAGTPLHGLGQALRSAAGAVVGAVTPPEAPAPARPAADRAGAAPTPTTADAPAAATGRPLVRGGDVAAARSQAAARQVAQLLDQAEALLDTGRTRAAEARLELAQRKLGEVLRPEREPLETRLQALRARAAGPPPAPQPADKQKAGRQAPPREAPASSASRKPAPAPAQPSRAERTGGKSSGGQGGSGQGRSGKGSAGKDSDGGAGKTGKGDGDGKTLLGQLSDSAASANPRA